MAHAKITSGGNLSTFVIDSASVTATPENNVLGTSGTLFGVYIDNTANSAITYLRLYNTASPTVGTTEPNEIYPCPASVARMYTIAEGTAYGTAVSFACVREAGKAGATSPASAVKVRLLVS
jgi:hypothetical protein